MTNNLIAGRLYCEKFIDFDDDVSYGRLAWFGSDGVFYDADSGEETYMDGDELVLQTGPINSEYIFN